MKPCSGLTTGRSNDKHGSARARFDAVALPRLAVPMLGRNDHPHLSEQAVRAADSGNHSRSLPPQLGAPGKAPACSHLVHDLSIIPAWSEYAGPRILKKHIPWLGARQTRVSPTEE